MKKLILPALCLSFCMGLFTLSSCSNEDEAAPKENGTAEISLLLATDGVTTKTGDVNIPNEYPVECTDGKYLKKADIEYSINGESHKVVTVDVIMVDGGKHKTKPFIDKAGKYTIHNVTTHDGTTPKTPLHSGVQSGAPLAAFVDYTLPLVFDVEPYTKPNINLSVLCTITHDPEEFGMPIFALQKVEVTCVPLFINYCDDNQDHTVWKGKLYAYRWDKKNDCWKLVKITKMKSGMIDHMCFGNDLDIENDDEYYGFGFAACGGTGYYNVQYYTVDQLLDYENGGAWNEDYNFIHLYFGNCGDEQSNIYINPGCQPRMNESTVMNFKAIPDLPENPVQDFE